MSTPSARPGPRAITRSAAWDLYVGAGIAVTIAAVWLFDHRFPGHPGLATVLLIGLAAWTTTMDRTAAREGRFGARSTVFAIGVIGLFTAGLCAAPAALAALPVTYALLFMSLPVRLAVIATTVVNVVPNVVLLVREGAGSPNLPIVAAITLSAVVAAPLIGTSITVTTLQREKLERLLVEVEARRAENATLAREAGVAAERERLARDIHDTLAQGFTSIVTLAQAAEIDCTDAEVANRLRLIGSTARDNLAEARTLVGALTPADLTENSLAQAIERQGRRLADEIGIVVTVDADAQLPTLPTAVEVVLLRAAQEALTNVRKHAHARSAAVTLESGSHSVTLTVADDGIGFDADAHSAGFGLRGMRSRAMQVGGSVTVSSTPGTGTVVDVEVPA